MGTCAYFGAWGGLFGLLGISNSKRAYTKRLRTRACFCGLFCIEANFNAFVLETVFTLLLLLQTTTTLKEAWEGRLVWGWRRAAKWSGKCSLSTFPENGNALLSGTRARHTISRLPKCLPKAQSTQVSARDFRTQNKFRISGLCLNSNKHRHKYQLSLLSKLAVFLYVSFILIHKFCKKRLSEAKLRVNNISNFEIWREATLRVFSFASLSHLFRFLIQVEEN